MITMETDFVYLRTDQLSKNYDFDHIVMWCENEHTFFDKPVFFNEFTLSGFMYRIFEHMESNELIPGAGFTNTLLVAINYAHETDQFKSE